MCLYMPNSPTESGATRSSPTKFPTMILSILNQLDNQVTDTKQRLAEVKEKIEDIQAKLRTGLGDCLSPTMTD